MRWTNPSVDSDGSFEQATGRDIRGRFYAPDHVEVGGTFNDDQGGECIMSQTEDMEELERIASQLTE